MTPKSRYFLVGASLTLILGLAVGLVAYYSYQGAAGLDPGLPAELRWVPSDADLVAYANVGAVMKSDLRRELENLSPRGPDSKHPSMHDVVGIDLEKQVSHVVAYVGHPASQSAPVPSELLVLVKGTFDPARVEDFLIQHGGTAEEYHAKRLVTRHHAGTDQKVQPREPRQEFAVGFVEPGLVAVGRTDLVRRTLDLPAGSRPSSSGNGEVMEMIKHVSGSTAWIVGRFDAVRKSAGMPDRLTQQMPPVKFFAAKADINGGLKATVRAETADQAAADQMREVVRGFVSLARMQGGSKPEFQAALKSIELSGTGNTVQMSFTLSPETFRAMAPVRRPPADLPPPER